MRQQLATPILYEFGNWLRELLASRQVLPKSPTAKLGYTMNQWQALCRYVEQGYLSMDNNSAERAVKTPAIGRKNYLFVGSEEAGQNAGIFYTLVGSAKRNGVEPYAWLKEIFQSLPNFRDSDFQHGRKGWSSARNSTGGCLINGWRPTQNIVGRSTRSAEKNVIKKNGPNGTAVARSKN
jgi:transposase